jgi:integrase
VRPKAESGEGKTPAIGDHQTRELLAAPGGQTSRRKRDRAVLSTLLYHALRREELCKLKVKDFRYSTKPTSPRCRNGSTTLTSPPPASTITRKTHPVDSPTFKGNY